MMHINWQGEDPELNFFLLHPITSRREFESIPVGGILCNNTIRRYIYFLYKVCNITEPLCMKWYTNYFIRKIFYASNFFLYLLTTSSDKISFKKLWWKIPSLYFTICWEGGGWWATVQILFVILQRKNEQILSRESPYLYLFYPSPAAGNTTKCIQLAGGIF